MTKRPDIEALEAAKKKLSRRYGKKSWCRGVGIARLNDGTLGLRINVAPEAASEELPTEYEGFAVNIVGIAQYRPRGSTRTPKRRTKRSSERGQ